MSTRCIDLCEYQNGAWHPLADDDPAHATCLACVAAHAIPAGEKVIVHTLDEQQVVGVRLYQPYSGEAGEAVVLRMAHGRSLNRPWIVVPASNVSLVEVV